MEMERTRWRLPTAAAAVLLAAILVALAAMPAEAADNSIRFKQCDIYANDPNPNYSQNFIIASGQVYCDQRRTITLTVYLQILRGGAWENSAKDTSTGRGVFSIGEQVSQGCSRYPSYYRTRSVATIDGDKASVHSTGSIVCPLSPQG